MADVVRRPYTDPAGPPIGTYTPDDNASGSEAQLVTIRGKNEAEKVEVRNSAPSGTEYGACVRIVGAAGLTDTELRASPVPVSVAGVATAANQTTIIGHLDGVEGLLTTIDADTGNIATRLSESDFDSKTGSLTETAPATDTASSGLNGRLQRIAQRLTSLIALLPSALVGGRLDVNVGAHPASLPAGTNNIGDVDVLTLPALPAGTNNIGDVDVLTVPADPFGANADAIVAAGATGSIQAKLRRVTQGLEDLKTLIVLGAGTNAIGKLAANSGVDIGDVDVLSLPGVAGTVAHDGADSGSPIKIGYKAIAHGANPTAVAANDRSDGYCNRAGIPWVIGGHPNIVTLEAAYTGAQTDAAIITVSAGTKIVVTQIQATCDNANTVDVGLRVGFGATTTPTTTGVVLTHPGIAAGSGISRGDGSGIIGIGADGEDLRITSEVPTSGSLRILVSYYTIES